MKKSALLFLSLLLLGVAFVSGSKLFDYFMDARAEDRLHEALVTMVEEPAEPNVRPVQVEAASEDERLEKAYQDLKNINGDFEAWLKIDGTDIHYPVVQASDNEYYLDKNIYKEKSRYGTLFFDATCDLDAPSDNLIIYGHNMKDGQMFGGLKAYTDKAFYEAHPVIRLDTLEVFSEYQIIAVFKTSVYDTVVGEFRYFEFIDAKDETEFDAFIQSIKKLSIYETGYSADFGDLLLTMSTCEYTSENGRLVITAKKQRVIYDASTEIPN